MNKLEMAQRFAEILLSSGLKGEWDLPRDGDMYTGIANDAWKIADAMQKEADERSHIGDSNEMADEWQPDWSQAPDDVVGWIMNERGKAKWITVINDVNWYQSAPSFNYQGTWQDSLRKRP